MNDRFYVFETETKELRDRLVVTQRACNGEKHVVKFVNDFNIEGVKPKKNLKKKLGIIIVKKGMCDGSCFSKRNGISFLYEYKN